MNEKLSRKAFVVCLVELIDTAIAHKLADEATAVLTGLRVLRPRLVELDILEARIAMKRRQFREAIHLLRNAESSATHWSLAKALMAGCQKQLHEPEWEINANEVLNASNSLPEALDMIAILKGNDKATPAEEATTTASTASFMADASYGGYMFHIRA